MGSILRHPYILAISTFVLVTFPLWTESIWALFSAEPLIPTLAAKVGASDVPEFKLAWISFATIPLGFVAAVLIMRSPHQTKSDESTEYVELDSRLNEIAEIIEAGEAAATTNQADSFREERERIFGRFREEMDYQSQRTHADRVLTRLEGLRAVGVRIRNDGEALQVVEELEPWISRIDEWTGQVFTQLAHLSEARAATWNTLNRMAACPFQSLSADHLLYLRIMEERLLRLEAITAEYRDRYQL